MGCGCPRADRANDIIFAHKVARDMAGERAQPGAQLDRVAVLVIWGPSDGLLPLSTGDFLLSAASFRCGACGAKAN